MAYFDFPSVGDIIKDFEKIENLPEQVIDEMLEAQAKVIVAAQERAVEEYGLIDTGELKNSISANKKWRVEKRGFDRYIDVYPKGTRKKRKLTSYRVSKKRRRIDSFRVYKRLVTNNEVAFIHEFGAASKNIPAKHWIKNANEGVAEEAAEVAGKIFEKFLNSLNL